MAEKRDIFIGRPDAGFDQQMKRIVRLVESRCFQKFLGKIGVRGFSAKKIIIAENVESLFLQ